MTTTSESDSKKKASDFESNCMIAIKPATMQHLMNELEERRQQKAMVGGGGGEEEEEEYKGEAKLIKRWIKMLLRAGLQYDKEDGTFENIPKSNLSHILKDFLLNKGNIYILYMYILFFFYRRKPYAKSCGSDRSSTVVDVYPEI